MVIGEVVCLGNKIKDEKKNGTQRSLPSQSLSFDAKTGNFLRKKRGEGDVTRIARVLKLFNSLNFKEETT